MFLFHSSSHSPFSLPPPFPPPSLFFFSFHFFPTPSHPLFQPSPLPSPRSTFLRRAASALVRQARVRLQNLHAHKHAVRGRLNFPRPHPRLPVTSLSEVQADWLPKLVAKMGWGDASSSVSDQASLTGLCELAVSSGSREQRRYESEGPKKSEPKGQGFGSCFWEDTTFHMVTPTSLPSPAKHFWKD